MNSYSFSFLLRQISLGQYNFTCDQFFTSNAFSNLVIKSGTIFQGNSIQHFRRKDFSTQGKTKSNIQLSFHSNVFTSLSNKIDDVRNRLQMSLLILTEFKRLNFYSSRNWQKNLWFSNNFGGNRN